MNAVIANADRAATTGAVLGLDIGGANLKAVHSDGACRHWPFALWKQPDRLAATLRELMQSLPACARLAVTMTGELCDCFANKREGVHAILDAVENAAANRAMHIWGVHGFLSVPAARARHLEVASANWHALATLLARELACTGILFDIGSTTADIIPFGAGSVTALGLTDPDRLRHGELVYTGVRRTPLCALLGSSVAAELFATTLDANLLLGNTAEDENDCDSADGRPATRAAAHARMARMLCADTELCTLKQAEELARRAIDEQLHCLTQAFERVTKSMPKPPDTIVLSGSGEFLARMVCDRSTGQRAELMSLAERWGPEHSTAACAYAVARLAVEP